MGRHGSVGSLIRIVGFIKSLGFRICLKLSNDSMGIFRIIFGNECFNSGRIEDGHICFCGINGLADGFCKINKLIKYELEII